MNALLRDRVCLRLETLEQRSHPTSLWSGLTADTVLLSSALPVAFDSSNAATTDAALVAQAPSATPVSEAAAMDLAFSGDSGPMAATRRVDHGNGQSESGTTLGDVGNSGGGDVHEPVLSMPQYLNGGASGCPDHAAMVTLEWTDSDLGIQRFSIQRDGRGIGAVSPHLDPSYQYHDRDASLVCGAGYSYGVQAIGNHTESPVATTVVYT